MPLHHRRRTIVGAASSVLALSLVTACSTPGGSAEPAEGGEVTVDVAAASAFLENYTQEQEFSITEPLAELPAAGASMVFIQPGSSLVGVKQAESLEAAADVLGMSFTAIDPGSNAESVNAALDSVVAMAPDVVITVSNDPTLFSGQIEALREAGSTVVAGGIVNGDEFGFDVVMAASDDVRETGKIMAAQALVDGDGDITDLVYYKTPELQFTTHMEQGAQEGVEEFCDGCTLRVVNIPIGEVGSTAPQRIVSDLQANPDTDATLASFDEIYTGVPTALDVAGIEVYTIGQAPVQATYEVIANGEQNATVAWDLDMMLWSMADQSVRELNGEDLTAYSKAGLLAKTVITEDNLPEDFAKGWVAFDDMRDQFTALWTAGQ